MLQSKDSGSDVRAPYLRAANVQPDGVLALDDVNEMWFRDAELEQLSIRTGDVVVVEGGQGGFGRAAYVDEDLPGWGFQNSINRLRPISDFDGRFIAFYLIALRASGFIRAYSNVVSMPHLTAEKLARIPMPLPPLEQQRAISDYLDRETARIDMLIEEQQRLIEMLRERRGAAISSAVARGLDETVVLKDSGLPGAGPVPAHWEVMPLRYTISFQEGPGIMAADFRDEGVPLLRVSCVRAARSTLEGCNYLDPDDVARRWSHFRVDLGDLLISASASMGTVSEVTEETAGAVPYTGIIRIKPGRMHKDFIRWFVVSGEFIDQVDSLKTGSTIQHFGPTHLAQMRVALPPIDEQRQIAAYLDEQTAKIDTLIAEAERFIELSKERRSALITAAVTGQIDVRETA
ncbi:restriction endonuclease subunit S [Rhodococcus sp. GA1]|uniref:restriction endonuclease subunit S n=1 Tax=Rhodococcus sp. GA1 TaxID=2942275 RepID=UPI0020CB90DD|nr:restriction endonuclease subunit S [Rhodococcus sp. GA1]